MYLFHIHLNLDGNNATKIPEIIPHYKKNPKLQVQAFQLFHRPILKLNDHSTLCLMSLKPCIDQ